MLSSLIKMWFRLPAVCLVHLSCSRNLYLENHSIRVFFVSCAMQQFIMKYGINGNILLFLVNKTYFNQLDIIRKFKIIIWIIFFIETLNMVLNDVVYKYIKILHARQWIIFSVFELCGNNVRTSAARINTINFVLITRINLGRP